MIRQLILIMLIPALSAGGIAVTEISRTPAGGQSAAPGGLSHEFIEITNFGPDTLTLDSLYLTDGVEADRLQALTEPIYSHEECAYGSAVIPPGGVALVLDLDYAPAIAKFPESRLPIASRTVLLTTADNDLGNGLAGDDGIIIYKGTRTAFTNVL